MSVVINTNYAATLASNNLAVSNASLQKSLNRLSSGSKIVNPADDAGGLAVSMKLSAAATRQGAVAANIGNAVSLLQTQDGALKVVGKILDRMSELSVLYNDVTKSTSDKGNYDSEFNALRAQLNSTASEKFNGVSLFGKQSGGADSTAGKVITTEDGQTGVSLSLADLTSTSQISVGGATLSGVGAIIGPDVTTAFTLKADGTNGVSLSTITDAIQSVATYRAINGAEQSRLGFANELVTVNKANLEAATSRITDVDVAAESTQLARWNILVQAGTAMLSQANQSAQSALKLIQ